MQVDAHGNPLTTPAASATASLDAAIIAFLAQRADTPALLGAALAADPECLVALALAGLAAMIAGRRPLHAKAATHLAAARRSASLRGATPREHAMVAALAAWVEQGDMPGAAALLEGTVAKSPLDPLCLRLAYGIRFMLGDAPGMRAAMEAALPAWEGTGLPAHGFLLGAYAFALEETGDFAAATSTAWRALDLRPDDIWGAHALVHVFEERGAPRTNLAFLKEITPRLQGVGHFAGHMHWHRALAHLHLGEGATALAIYDSDICPAVPDTNMEVRDVLNTVSLLWRLADQGIAPGPTRWAAMADLAESRIGDHGWSFVDMHYLLALAATGRRSAVQAMLASLAQASTGPGTQAATLRTAGLDVAHAIAAAHAGAPGEAVRRFDAVAKQAHILGGSHAQQQILCLVIQRARRECGIGCAA